MKAMGRRMEFLLFWGARARRLVSEGSSIFTLILSARSPRAPRRDAEAPGMALA
jgi:hypothetical protein